MKLMGKLGFGDGRKTVEISKDKHIHVFFLDFLDLAISVSVSNIECVCLGQARPGQCLDKTGSWEVTASNYLYDLHRLQSVRFKVVKFNIFMIILCIDRGTFLTRKHPILSTKKIRIFENFT